MRDKANHIRSLLCALFLLAASCTAATGKVIYVDSDAVAEFDGSDWAFACRTLQDAISKVWFGDEIRVAKGIYRPDRRTTISGGGRTGSVRTEITASGDQTATFELIYNVTFKGGYAGYGEPDPNVRDFEKYETILSGDLDANDINVNSPKDLLTEPSRAENSYHVVTVRGMAVLDGFTITGGNAGEGGGLLNRYGMPQIINCTFRENSARNDGGAMYNDMANPSLFNCTFTGNYAGRNGGAISNNNSRPDLNNCTFSHNSAWYGGGAMHNNDSMPYLVKCTFVENSSRYGGSIYNQESDLGLTNCAFLGNYGSDYGGGMYNTSSSNLILNNCTFSANQAGSYGAGISSNRCDLVLTNCTFAKNSAPEGNAMAFNGGQSIVELRNCILWDDIAAMWINDSSKINVLYSNISGGWPGEGNTDFEPIFVDADGPDHIPGTEDDDLRLAPLSPCVDSGDPLYVSGPDETDFDGNPRVVGGRVDMGAYEFQPLIYVDDDAPGDLAPGNPNISDPQEDGTDRHPFDTIQEAIDIAKDGHAILVRPGVYSKIDFMGKAITVAGIEGAAIIEAWTQGQGAPLKEDAVTFHTGEGPGSVLKNFIIRNSGMAISLNYGSSPTITNLTIVDNNFGIAAYENSNPGVSNCIFWGNRDGDLFQCDLRYSCLEGDVPGRGNISVNPLFVDAAGGDYHLKSEGWRWNTNNELSAYDNVTSLCIDAGDPACPLGDEPMSAPRDPDNEYGVNLRINMGAYGGTCQASIPPLAGLIPEYETDPPEPDPAQWAPDGAPREVEVHGVFLVQMTAAETTDASGPVEYFFECTTDAGFSSEWQSSPTYSVFVDQGGQGHRFRVKARDQIGNETDWSEELSTN